MAAAFSSFLLLFLFPIFLFIGASCSAPGSVHCSASKINQHQPCFSPISSCFQHPRRPLFLLCFSLLQLSVLAFHLCCPALHPAPALTLKLSLFFTVLQQPSCPSSSRSSLFSRSLLLPSTFLSVAALFQLYFQPFRPLSASPKTHLIRPLFTAPIWSHISSPYFNIRHPMFGSVSAAKGPIFQPLFSSKDSLKMSQ